MNDQLSTAQRICVSSRNVAMTNSQKVSFIKKNISFKWFEKNINVRL